METVYTYLNLLDSGVSVPPDGILSRTIHDGASLRVVVFTFAAGQELSEHTAAMPAILQMVQGRARVTLGGDTREVEAGAWIEMPARLPHSVRAETPLVMVLLMLKERAD